MRELKFRALKDDVSNCCFYYGSIIYDKNNVPKIHDVDTELFHTCIKGTEGQFTGLYDKNGKEIYEGDICKTTYYNHIEKNSVFTQVVVFESGTFAVKSKDSVVSQIDDWRSFSSLHNFFMPTPNKIEVLGNIHENPELL